MRVKIGSMVRTKRGDEYLHVRSTPLFLPSGTIKQTAVLQTAVLHDKEIGIIVGIEGSDAHAVCITCGDGVGWISTAFIDVIDD